MTSIRNIFIIFLVSGFWHGANWTFIAWGAFHSILYLPLFLLKRNRKNISEHPRINDLLPVLKTYLLVCIGWIFFRAENITQASHMVSEILSGSLFSPIQVSLRVLYIVALIVILIVLEWLNRKHEFTLEKLGSNWNTTVRWSFYSTIILLIAWFAKTGTSFIYFQF